MNKYCIVLHGYNMNTKLPVFVFLFIKTIERQSYICTLGFFLLSFLPSLTRRKTKETRDVQLFL